jgi:hypothetical protein
MVMTRPVATLSAANRPTVPWRLSSWVTVRLRPGVIGSDGWARSNAWTCVLSVDAEHDRPLRWVEVQPDDVDELLLEPGVGGDPDRVDPLGADPSGPLACARRCARCAPQIRATVSSPISNRSAIDLVDHAGSSPGGDSCRVASTTAAAISAGTVGLRAPARRGPAPTVDTLLGEPGISATNASPVSAPELRRY